MAKKQSVRLPKPISTIHESDKFFAAIESGELDITLDKGRNYESTAFCGDKRRGKTTLVNILIHDYRKKYPNRPVLIADYSDAFGEKEFKGLKIPGYDAWTVDELINGKKIKVNGQIKRAKWNIDPKKGPVGIIRVIGFNDGEDFDKLLEYISEEFRRGLFVFDEAATFFEAKATLEQRALLIKHTNSQNEIWCIFHRLLDVPIALRHHFWNYVLFATGDEFASWKDIEKAKFPDPKRFFERFRNAKDFPVLKDDGRRNLISFYEIFCKDISNPAELVRAKKLKDMEALAEHGRMLRDKGIDAITVEEQLKVIRR